MQCMMYSWLQQLLLCAYGSFLYLLCDPLIRCRQLTPAAQLCWHISGGAYFYHNHSWNTFHYHKICEY